MTKASGLGGISVSTLPRIRAALHLLKLMVFATLGVGLGAANLAASASPAPAVDPDLEADPKRILAHVRALQESPDETHAKARKGDAADYIAAQFAAYGLKPAGNEGSYFQDVPMTRVRTLTDSAVALVSTSLETLSLRIGDDVLISNPARTAAAYIDAPVVFAGYGIRAPEYDWDDYKDVDVRGKVVLLLANEPTPRPADFHGHAPSRYGSWEYKFAEAERRGAVAALIVSTADPTGASWNEVRRTWGTARYYPQDDAAPTFQAAGWIHPEALRKLAALAELNGTDTLAARAQAGDFMPTQLPLRLQALIASEVRPVDGRMVIAVLPARGGTSHEALLYSAQYNRRGDAEARAARGGDEVSPVGAAMLLETARLWSQSSPPQRMVLFAALPPEDNGVAEAAYLSDRGPVSAGRTSLALTYRAYALGGDAHHITAGGADRTSFSTLVDSTAKSLGLAIAGDSQSASAYGTSAYTLAQAGIPSISLGGSTPGTLAQFGYQLGAQAVSQPKLVGWIPGDEFEAERKRNQLTAQTGHMPLVRKPKRHK